MVAVTVTGNEQEAAAASDPPLKEIELGAVVVRVPPHGVELPPATVKPAGSVSVKATPLKAAPVFGLVTVKVRVDVAFTATGSGENAIIIVGGLGTLQPVIVILSRFI